MVKTHYFTPKGRHLWWTFQFQNVGENRFRSKPSCRVPADVSCQIWFNTLVYWHVVNTMPCFHIIKQILSHMNKRLKSLEIMSRFHTKSLGFCEQYACSIFHVGYFTIIGLTSLFPEILLLPVTFPYKFPEFRIISSKVETTDRVTLFYCPIWHQWLLHLSCTQIVLLLRADTAFLLSPMIVTRHHNIPDAPKTTQWLNIPQCDA